MPFPPDAYLIGAQKAGTTSLAFLLARHPDVSLSEPKEPHFFTLNWPLGLDWYRTVFPRSSAAVLLDASTSYTMAPTDRARTRGPEDSPLLDVPRRIHSLNPRGKFIYVLRDPVTRTNSHYWHAVRQGEERRDFRGAIAADDLYLRIGDYHAQLCAYLEYFPRDAFLVLIFEEMIRDPMGTARRCCEFLDLPVGKLPVQAQAARKNASFRYRGPARALSRVLGARGWRSLVSGAQTVIPRRLRHVVAAAVATRVPPMRESDRAFLAEHFREPNRRLEQLTGISLDLWAH